MEDVDWIRLAQVKAQWWILVTVVMNLRVCKNGDISWPTEWISVFKKYPFLWTYLVKWIIKWVGSVILSCSLTVAQLYQKGNHQNPTWNMGNISSQEQVEPDPWWEPNQLQHCSTQNVNIWGQKFYCRVLIY